METPRTYSVEWLSGVCPLSMMNQPSAGGRSCCVQLGTVTDRAAATFLDSFPRAPESSGESAQDRDCWVV